MGERSSVSLSSRAKIVEARTEAKAEALQDFISKPLLQPLNTPEVINGFQYDTSGNRHITLAYCQIQVSAFCEFGPKSIRKPSSQNSESLKFSAVPFKKKQLPR